MNAFQKSALYDRISVNHMRVPVMSRQLLSRTG